MEKKSKVLLQNRICSCSRVFSSNKQFIDMKYLDKIVALYTNIEGTVIKMCLSGIDVDTKTYSLISSIRTSTGNIRIDNTNAEGSAIYEYGPPYASINEFNEKCDVSADLNIFATSCAMANTVLGFQVNDGADMKFKWYAEIKIDMLVAEQDGEFKGRLKNGSQDVVAITDIKNDTLNAIFCECKRHVFKYADKLLR